MSRYADLEIFREYDIRGLAEGELDDAFCRDFGLALACYYRAHGLGTVLLGRDNRLSSKRIEEKRPPGSTRAAVMWLR